MAEEQRPYGKSGKCKYCGTETKTKAKPGDWPEPTNASQGKIFIPGNVPSSKNSKTKTRNGIFHSKTVQKYLRFHNIKSYSMRKREITPYSRSPCLFPFVPLKIMIQAFEPPFFIGFHFVRDSRRKADFDNLTQILADLFVAGGVIPEDDMTCFFSVPIFVGGGWFSIDKHNPGVKIMVLKESKMKYFLNGD